MKKKSGESVVEYLIVLAVIALLMTVLFPGLKVSIQEWASQFETELETELETGSTETQAVETVEAVVQTAPGSNTLLVIVGIMLGIGVIFTLIYYVSTAAHSKTIEPSKPAPPQKQPLENETTPLPEGITQLLDAISIHKERWSIEDKLRLSQVKYDTKRLIETYNRTHGTAHHLDALNEKLRYIEESLINILKHYQDVVETDFTASCMLVDDRYKHN